ncbi:alpha/beta hydrolase [Chachezhania antarctica]|uniref:alpha/beta hydrolase n=1 Tax=Chachezhania antarctica TaxID=2340860 RepID=UPI000EAEAA6B|nr:alpha/beta hydrolase [Chachezhania antarctica]|tara:strand:- start:2715 stop:3527 length:813 start_codon:yes stop_codon:yes gene_type:complete
MGTTGDTVENLNEAYANGAFIPSAEEFPPRWEAEAAAFREGLGARARPDLPYGRGTRERYDLFLPEGAALGTVIFVHGGYWQAFDKSSWSHLAAGPLARGWAVAMPSYDLCPGVRIADITRQIAQAVAAIAAERPGTLALTGHSAGGHLVARMRDRALVAEDTARRIAHIMPISPLGDLRPLMQTDMNADFRLNVAEAEAESPILTADLHDVAVTVWVGAEERPGFLDQAQWLADAWRVEQVVASGKHHFDVIDDLADPESLMVRRLTGR